MNIDDFKIIRNKQRPEFCYAYEKYNSGKTKKYSLFTIDGGKSFLASITSTNGSGKLVDTDFSITVDSVEKGICAINQFEEA